MNRITRSLFVAALVACSLSSANAQLDSEELQGRGEQRGKIVLPPDARSEQDLAYGSDPAQSATAAVGSTRKRNCCRTGRTAGLARP